MGMLDGLAAGIASFAGNIFNANSQQAINRDQITLSKEQMDWQARMSNTAHSREVKDLKEAGLNPILSAGGNGASTPAGSTPNLTAPQIDMPSIVNAIQAAQTIDQNQQKINIEKANSAASIAKNLTEQDLNKMKKVLMQKGLIRAELEGEGASMIQNLLNALKKQWHSNSPPKYPKNWNNLMEDDNRANLP